MKKIWAWLMDRETESYLLLIIVVLFLMLLVGLVSRAIDVECNHFEYIDTNGFIGTSKYCNIDNMTCTEDNTTFKVIQITKVPN